MFYGIACLLIPELFFFVNVQKMRVWKVVVVEFCFLPFC
jgi:hypothetical protein